MNPQKQTPYKAGSAEAQASRPSMIANAFDKTVVIRAMIMAVVVGTILITINHGMCIYAGHFNFTCFWQSALTFLVPYSVSTVSSVLAMEKPSRPNRA